MKKRYTSITTFIVYICNNSTDETYYITIVIDAKPIGRLYGGDWMFIPYEGEQGIDISSTNTNMELEYMVIYQTV